ncbi:tryptophan synthase beta subunit [Paucibacter oligotrophus]|uniref:Tryptophan synthase beta subunit n=1 Tax=Roseateles oligotrophus TaxID=1769250 RepID=A0A840L8B7_9BURK|nr:tryptophan synthase beta subunit [Roseateles oligotrophus]
MDETIHRPRFFAGHVVGNIEALHLTSELAGESGSIKSADAVNAGLTGQDIGPALSHRVTHGADQTKTSDDDATTAHAVRGSVSRNAGALQLRPSGA